MLTDKTDIKSIFAQEALDLGGLLDAFSLPASTEFERDARLSLQLFSEKIHDDYFSLNKDSDEYLRMLYDNLHCDLLNNLDVNAFAFKSDKFYFIGINAGSLLVIQQAFFTLLSHPAVLQDIGNIANETPKFDSIPFGFPLTNKKLENISDISPKDTVRWHYCLFLTSCAMRFLMLHELGHILYGHIDYIAQIGARPLLSEIPQQDNSPFSSDTLQALEFQADMFASQIYASQIDNPRSMNVLDFMLNRTSTLEEIIRGKLFAVGILFRLFAQNERRPREISKNKLINYLYGKNTAGTIIEKGTHPRIKVRFNSCIYEMSYYMDKKKKKEINDIFESISKTVLIEVEKVWSMLKLPGHPSIDRHNLASTEVCDESLLTLANDLLVKKANALSPIPSLRTSSESNDSMSSRAAEVIKRLKEDPKSKFLDTSVKKILDRL